MYTNWRGKQFVIDESFVDDMRKRISMDDRSDPNELACLMPEVLMEMIPWSALKEVGNWRNCGMVR